MSEQKEKTSDEELYDIQALMATEFKAVMTAARGGMPDDRAYDWIGNITPYLCMAVGITMLKGMIDKSIKHEVDLELVVATNYQHIQDVLKKNYDATMNIRRACLEEFAPSMVPKKEETT